MSEHVSDLVLKLLINLIADGLVDLGYMLWARFGSESHELFLFVDFVDDEIRE